MDVLDTHVQELLAVGIQADALTRWNGLDNPFPLVIHAWTMKERN